MKVEIENSQATATTLIVQADSNDMAATKTRIQADLTAGIKLPGFRQGKVPPELALKEINENLLSETFLKSFVPQLAQQALLLKEIRPVLMPEVSVTKFVPFEQLEMTIKTEHFGEIKLANWRKISLKMPELKATVAEINKVLERIRLDFADFKSVSRAAKLGDRVWLDFQGADKQGQAISGASGRDYPLLLGEGNFIAGFEEKIVAHKVAQNLEFELHFPKDHLPRYLADQAVTFKVEIKKVESVTLPVLDNVLATKAGGFKDLAEMKRIVKKQLLADKQQKTKELLLGQAVAKIAQESKIEIPAGLKADELRRLQNEHQAWLQENQLSLEVWLKEAKLTAVEHDEKLKMTVVNRLKGGLILRQIASEEKIMVAEEEVERRLGRERTDSLSESQLLDLKQDVRAQLLVRKALDRLSEIVFDKKAV